MGVGTAGISSLLRESADAVLRCGATSVSPCVKGRRDVWGDASHWRASAPGAGLPHLMVGARRSCVGTEHLHGDGIPSAHPRGSSVSSPFCSRVLRPGSIRVCHELGGSRLVGAWGWDATVAQHPLGQWCCKRSLRGGVPGLIYHHLYLSYHQVLLCSLEVA